MKLPAILVAAAFTSTTRSFYNHLPLKSAFSMASAAMSSSSPNSPYYDERAELCTGIQANGIRDPRVLAAMIKVSIDVF